MWQDLVQELLNVHGEDKIRRQMTGTVRDNVECANITRLMNERGIHRTQKQVTQITLSKTENKSVSQNVELTL